MLKKYFTKIDDKNRVNIMESARKVFSNKYLNSCICFRSDKKYKTDSFFIIGLITNKEVGDVVPKFLVEILSMCKSRDPFLSF